MKKLKKIGTVLLVTSFALTSPCYALTKNETVYSKLNNNGSVKTTIVSEYLKNTDDVINDETNLKNILNLNGNEKYKLEGTSLVWDAKGKDIYYQGETEAELPVDLNISYKLNNENIDLKDLLGKKGHVEITLKYINKEKHNVLVNGSYEDLYTPFIVTLGTIISNDNNTNIDVTNGKVISNGKNSIVVAIASPGLYDSLNIDNIKDFDKIVLSYDTDNFELSSIYSVITSNLISNDDLKIFDRLDPIYSNVNKLVDSSKQLENGSNTLLEGSKKIANGAKELNDGINKAYVGSEALNNTLSSKIDETKNNVAIDDNKLSMIKMSAVNKALETYNTQEDMIKTKTLKTITDNETIIKNQAIAAIKENDTYKLYALKVKSAEEIPGFIDLVAACSVEDKTTIPEALAPTCVQKKDDITNYLTAKNVLKLMEVVASETAYQTSQQVAIQTALTTSKEVMTETASSVAENVAISVANSAKETTINSLETLNQNITTLTNGLGEINKGSNELKNGTDTLSNGAETLATGISKFNNEGIMKISNLVNGDLKTTEEKVKALINLGNAYDTFTLKDSNTKGETKFVLVVDGEREISSSKKKNIEETKKETIIDKIKEIFKK